MGRSNRPARWRALQMLRLGMFHLSAIPFIPAGAALSVRGSSSVRPACRLDPRQIGTMSVSYEWCGNNCGSGTLSVHSPMTATLIGYARCSTDRQDLAAQHQALLELGVAEDRIYTDHGLTGTTRARPGLGPSPPCAKAIRWSYRNSTGWPGPSRMRAPSPTSLGNEA